MKTTKRNLGKLSLSKLNIAKVGDINNIYGGTNDDLITLDICTHNCGNDTIDTQ